MESADDAEGQAITGHMAARSMGLTLGVGVMTQIGSVSVPKNLQHSRELPLMIRFQFQLAMLMLACCILAGCQAAPPVKRDVLVGDYVYKSEDPEGKPKDHEFDHLTLQADGKYDLVQGGPTKPKIETVGTWIVWDGGSDGQRVLLDRSGYPVQIKGGEIRLLIDNDVGIWFGKVK